MKKLLLSLSFLIASGAYVAGQNGFIPALRLADTLEGDLQTGALPDSEMAPDPPDSSEVAVATADDASDPPGMPSALAAPSEAAPTISDEPPASQVHTEADASASSSSEAVIVSQPAVSLDASPTSSVPEPVVALPAPQPRRRPLAMIVPPVTAAADAGLTVPVPKADVPAPKAAAALPKGKFRNGVYSGSSENAFWGQVAVQVKVSGNRITSVVAVDYPQDRGTSRRINAGALPILQREAIAAQSANVDVVSGATLTSRAYARSLRTALQKAAASNA